MGVLINSWSQLFLLAAFFAFLYLYLRYRVNSRHWLKRNVPHLEPVFLLGNLWRASIKENMSDIFKRWHLQNKDKKILGFWVFTKPNVLVMDLDLVKRMLVKDFNSFRDRGLEIDTNQDPLGGHLFALNGKRWRNLRVKLTPTFTSGKMKLMFPIIVQCGRELQSYLRGPAENKEVVEVKDLLARFMTDVISSVAFGLETNSIRNPDSEFREFGKKIFKFDLRSLIIHILFAINPAILPALKIRFIKKDVSDFFINAVRETIDYREKNNVTRNDFLQLLIQLMKVGKIENADKTTTEDVEDTETDDKFTLNEAAAQCFVFFIAGFETSSSLISFGLYELALNPDIQTKLQNNIDEVLENYNNEITYESLSKMEYLDMVVGEILRKYPPVPRLQRKCASDYYIPELDATINKGVMVMFSVSGIHYDPDTYPEPEKFDPERFSEREKEKRDPFAFIPFGEGPRNCIGNRLGLMQVKIGLLSILRDYNVEVCKETPIPIVFNVRTFIPTPVGGMPLVFTTRA